MITSLNHLFMLYPTFSHYYLSAMEAVLSTLEDERIELPQLLCPIINFVSTIIRGGKCHQWLREENILSLITSTINYVQMTNDDVSSSAILQVPNFSLLFQA